MTAISLSNLLTAFGITLAAGLATVLGSALVFFFQNAVTACVGVWFGVCWWCDGVCVADGNF